MIWYDGTELGEHYSSILAWGTDAPPIEPDLVDRGTAALVDPTKPGSMTTVVNAVTREVGMDVADWNAGRIVNMAAQIQAEAARRDQ